MKRPSTDDPIDWDKLIREARGRAFHHRTKGEEKYAAAEERFASYCVHRQRAEFLRSGEPDIPGVTSWDDVP